MSFLPGANLSSSGARASGSSQSSSSQYKFLPGARFSSTTTAPASKSDLAATTRAVSERQLTLAAENAPLRITYGQDRLGALLGNVFFHNNKWVVLVVWGQGPIDSINNITFSDKPVPAGVTVTNYLGNPGQTADPAVTAAFAALGVTYTDTLPNVAYTVFQIGSQVEGWESIAAVIKGRKVYDPRADETVWSDNPSLAMGDFMSNFAYGARLEVSNADIAALADIDDEVVGAEKRRIIGLTLDRTAEVSSWIETLRTYAGALRPIMRDGVWRIIPDRPSIVHHTFDHALGEIFELSGLKRRGLKQAPTVIRILWTDTSSVPWVEREAIARLSGVLEGTTPLREQQIRLEGIQSASQAYREAVERLNKLNLSDLSFSIVIGDEGLAVEEGDIVAVTHPIGLDAKQMRVLGVSILSPGRYQLDLSEYDPAAYSDSVQSEPTTPDTNLPNPGEPIAPTGLTLDEVLFQKKDGTWASRLEVSWTAPAFPFVDHYRIDVISGSTVVETGTAKPGTTTWPSGEVKELVEYQVDVYTISVSGATSDPVSDTFLAQGKLLPPADVTGLNVIEVGGEVRSWWSKVNDIDVVRYGVAWGAVGVAKASATLLDVVDSLRFETRDIPVGTWDFLVWAIDSVGGESENVARKSVTVTLDNAAFLAEQVEFSNPTLSNMTQYTLGPTDTVKRYITEDGVSVATKFPGVLSGYANALQTYQTTASSLTTETSPDPGTSISGDWRGTISSTAVVGTKTDQIELSPNGSTWTAYDISAKATGRFSRLKSSASSGSVLAVTIPEARIRVDALARQETGSGTTVASGPTTITLANGYAAVKSISITPLGTGSRTYAVDNIDLVAGTFDVYLFDAVSGVQVAGDFLWEFNGV